MYHSKANIGLLCSRSELALYVYIENKYSDKYANIAFNNNNT